MATKSPVLIDADILGGTPCFAGTRVPVKSLFSTLGRGRSIDYFIEQFPTVSKDQAARVLQLAELAIERNLVPGINDPTDLDSLLSPLNQALTKATEILARVDEDGLPVVQPAAFERARAFLGKFAEQAWSLYHRIFDLPSIQPGPDGSVDLHWKNAASETLVNIPADSGPITYYGDDQSGNSVKGNLATVDGGGLLLWLTNKN